MTIPRTPAAELRQAALHMREHHGPGHPRHKFWGALAGWLEDEASEYDDLSADYAAFRAGFHGGDLDPSLAVARAYLEGIT